MRLALAVVGIVGVALAAPGARAEDSSGAFNMGTTTGGGEILSNAKVISLAEAGIKDELILRIIKNASRTQFDLNVDTGILQLKNAGVSDAVINVMMDIWEKQRKLHDRNIRIFVQLLRTDRLDEYDRAVRELVAYGAYAVPLLVEHLRNEDERIRAGCCEVIGRIAAPESLEALFGALADRNKSVRWKAARSLSLFRDRDAIAERLAAELKRRGQYRDGFALALGHIGDLKYLPGVLELADDPGAGEDQAAAAYALGLLGDPTPEVLEVLKEAVLDYPLRELRESGARALARLAPKMDKRTRQDVALALSVSAKRYASGRDVIALQLRHFPARKSVETLIELVADRDRNVSGSAWEALKAVTGEVWPQDEDQWRSWWEIAQIQPRWREEPPEDAAPEEGEGRGMKPLPKIPGFDPSPKAEPAGGTAE